MGRSSSIAHRRGARQGAVTGLGIHLRSSYFKWNHLLRLFQLYCFDSKDYLIVVMSWLYRIFKGK